MGMQIRRMRATFGKLEQSELTALPGLNIIYAPNESGKSTWSRFIQNMLYGLNTRDPNELADKRRYAPWSGAAMGGRMDVTVGGEDYTILRQTKRANAPMGDFSCTFSDTANAVPGITAQNAGEVLLGVPREVFERSAFIGQAALAVDKSKELEKRIAALITTGEEDTSYSEAYERLKKQLNKRKSNRTTGQIPALDGEITQLDETLERVESLQSQYRDTDEQVQRFQAQAAELEAMRAQWDELARREQWAQYQAVQQAETEARQRVQALLELTGHLPEERQLSRMENQLALAGGMQIQLEQGRKDALAQAELAQKADAAFRRHPLYPADEEELQARLDHMRAPAIPRPALFRILLASAAVALAGSGAFAACHAFLWAAISAGVCLIAGIGGLWLMLRRAALKRHAEETEAHRAVLEQQLAQYLPLRRQAKEDADAAARAEALRSAAQQQLQTAQDALLSDIRLYRPETQNSSAEAVLQEMRRHTDALGAARQALRDTEVRRAALEQHLPEKPSGETISPPPMSRSQVEAALPQAQVNLHAARSRLDTLSGQLRAIGDPDALRALRSQRAEQRDIVQAQYDAIAMAMSALEQANLILQNRFSPALGQRAAEIFSAITGGKYQKVLLSRDFALSAEPTGDDMARSIRLFSQGAADQLYLAVRLAICDMVLPGDDPAPLIIDDALVSFDNERLHAALDYLLQESKHRQILLFTCQKREQEYLAGHDGVTVTTL